MALMTRFSFGLACALLIGLPARAAADLRLTPFAGVTFIEEERKGTFGAAITAGGLFGVEFEAARIQLGGFGEVPGVDLEAHATTYMGNVVVRLPVGPVQPYGSAGVGLVRVTGSVDVAFVGDIASASVDDLGWNVGGGVYVFPTENFGIRGDVRRFQTGAIEWDDIGGIGGFDDLPLPNFDFWRATVGVTLRF
jgi:opacity protein-like surface antigen